VGGYGGHISAVLRAKVLLFYNFATDLYANEMKSIREADGADVPLIRRMAQEAFPATYRDILTPGQITYMMEWMYSAESLRRQMEGGHVFFIGEEDGVAAGYASVEPQGPDLCHLQKLYVRPAVQGRGWGKALFTHAAGFARSLGARRMELNVNRHNPARGFYARMGMREAGQGDFPIGQGFFMNDYILSLDL